MKNSNEMVKQAQKAFDDFMDGRIGDNELASASRMVDSMTKIAVIKLKYNQFQNDHSKIEYLEGS